MDEEKIGFVAQDQLSNIPYCILTEKKKKHPDDTEKTDIYHVKADPIIFVLVNAVKELSADLAQAKKDIFSLQVELQNLKVK